MSRFPTHSSIRRLALLAGLACLALSACATEEPTTCPQGARHMSTETGVQACIFDQVQLPDARGLRIYCDNAERGHVDFSWEHNPWTLGYSCPEGWERSDGLPGLSACRSPSSEMTSAAPAEQRACGRLPSGAIAMAWKSPSEFSAYSRFAATMLRGISPFVPDLP
ncbi:MAG: hypothetical protein CL940_10005 [Deltaproteobacteria bacterium]|nr:hypothetical protein [Deltaproteobacteria bacterium]